MKKIAALFLALIMLFSISACGTTQAPEVSEETERSFTDSVGREVTLPAEIEKVAVSGPLAQITMFALCPDKLVGIATAWDDTAKEYLDTQYYDLPVIGQLYGGKGDLNPETLLQSGAQIVIDVGEPKGASRRIWTACRPRREYPSSISAPLSRPWVTPTGSWVNCWTCRPKRKCWRHTARIPMPASATLHKT